LPVDCCTSEEWTEPILEDRREWDESSVEVRTEVKLDGDGSRLVELGWYFEKKLAGIGDGMELLRGWVG